MFFLIWSTLNNFMRSLLRIGKDWITYVIRYARTQNATIGLIKRTSSHTHTLLKTIWCYNGILYMSSLPNHIKCLHALIKFTFAQLYFSLLSLFLLLWYCVSVCVHTKLDRCAECVPYSIMLRKVRCVCVTFFS